MRYRVVIDLTFNGEPVASSVEKELGAPISALVKHLNEKTHLFGATLTDVGVGLTYLPEPEETPASDDPASPEEVSCDN